jgi:hypothetical protein
VDEEAGGVRRVGDVTVERHERAGGTGEGERGRVKQGAS